MIMPSHIHNHSNSDRLSIDSFLCPNVARNVQNGLLLIGVHLFAKAFVVPRAFCGRSHRMDVAVEGVPSRTAWQRGMWSSTWSWHFILAPSMAVVTILICKILHRIHHNTLIRLIHCHTYSRHFTSICSDTKHFEQQQCNDPRWPSGIPSHVATNPCVACGFHCSMGVQK